MNNKAQQFRARIVDFAKPIPIYREYEISALQNFPAVTRMVQDIPTGMEKNEEKELHLIKAIDAGQAIPVPEVEPAAYNLTPYIMPKQLIKYHPFPLDEEGPDYDADSEDELFLKKQSGIHIDVDQFEKMIGVFENSSTRKVLTQDEAKRLFPDDIIVTLCVYEYWLYKRLRLKHPLIPTIPTEDRLTKNTAYVAFRKRIDKRVTRRNRRNDENSYYRMLRIKADLEKTAQILEMVKQREILKRDFLKSDIELLDLRYKARDFNETVYRNVLREEALQAQSLPPQPKRKYTKQKKHPKINVERKLDEEENDPFVFRRKLGCSYLAPVSDSLTQWQDDLDGFIPATLDGSTVVLARRRLGRGGRVILDRRVTPYSFFVNSTILREIQSRAVGELREGWSIEAENTEDGSTFQQEMALPEVAPEEQEVVYIRGKKSFAEHLNEIRYSRETPEQDLLNGYQRICV